MQVKKKPLPTGRIAAIWKEQYSDRQTNTWFNANTIVLGRYWSPIGNMEFSYYYSKSGCCANVAEKANSSRFFFYIPLHFTCMSVGQVRKYIADLSDMGIPIEAMPNEYALASIPEDPENPASGPISINTVDNCFGAGGTQEYLRLRQSHANLPTKYLIVKVDMKRINGSTKKMLYVMQMVRMLYTLAQVTTLGGARYEYYSIPQMYFRLRNFFPELTKEKALLFAMCFHGGIISSTYFPYYHWLKDPVFDKMWNVKHFRADVSINETVGKESQYFQPTSIAPFNVLSRRVSANRADTYAYNYTSMGISAMYRNGKHFGSVPAYLVSTVLRDITKRPTKKNLRFAMELLFTIWTYMRANCIHANAIQRVKSETMFPKMNPGALARPASIKAKAEHTVARAATAIANSESRIISLVENCDLPVFKKNDYIEF
jgi:hypothetical protein